MYAWKLLAATFGLMMVGNSAPHLGQIGRIGSFPGVSIAATDTRHGARGLGRTQESRQDAPASDPKKLLDEYQRELTKRDFAALRPLIADDAVFWFNDGSFVGLEAIRIAFETNFANYPLENFWIDEVSWVALDANTANCIYRYHWTAQASNGVVEGGGRGTTIMRRASGLWKIAHIHLSQEPGSAMLRFTNHM